MRNALAMRSMAEDPKLREGETPDERNRRSDKGGNNIVYAKENMK